MSRSALYAALSTVAALALISGACSKDDKKKADGSGATAAGKGGGAAPAKGGDSASFPGWDLAGRKAAFQGAHVMPGGGLGAWEAWDVKGEQVTIWDGTAEKTLELTVTTPCSAKVTEKSANGSSSTISHFTIKGGAIVLGLGSAGSRKGAEAIACVSNKIVTVDAGGACKEWEPDMFDDSKWKSAPGTCGFAKDGDKEVFKATANGTEYTLLVDGDALMTRQLAETHSEKVADFAAAKAARDSKK